MIDLAQRRRELLVAGQPWRYLISGSAQTLLVVVAASLLASLAALPRKASRWSHAAACCSAFTPLNAGLLPLPTGTVKWFNAAKGYGFIQPEGGGADAFVHISAVEAAGLSTLNEGQRVQYELVQGQKGKSSAENLKLVS
jgi:CspA family cold shock protein